ncbi:hypothetical protein UI24_10325 [Mycobacteroides franklinii]|nr:hypothetical protein [Mycobacteroides franklinii]
MTPLITAGVLTAVLGAAGAPARADPDTDFGNALHTYGIYGAKDYNAWIAKITCERLARGTDVTTAAAVQFVSQQLADGPDTAKAQQFLDLATATYCPVGQPANTDQPT